MAGPTPDEIAHFRKVFDLIDADQDGVINKSEMKAVMALIGHDVTDHDVKKVISDFDKNKNGVIEWEEFIDLLHDKKKNDEERLREVFERLDTDSDGSIGPEELKRYLEETGLSHEINDFHLRLMVKTLDTNGDGKIQFEEFLALMHF